MLRQPNRTIYTKNITSTSSGTDAFVIDVNDFDSVLFKLDVATLSGGTSPTIDVYFQTSLDGGSTFKDVCHFAQITAATTNSLFAISSSVKDAYIGAVGDASISAGSVGIPVASKYARLKYVISGSPTSVDFTASAILVNQQ
jgi:hypothetical protein